MQTDEAENRILFDITDHIRLTFGIEVLHAEANPLGFANLKWKLDTNEGPLFLKQYSHTRYSDELLQGVEQALQLQHLLYLQHIPCPTLLDREGAFIQRTVTGERYVLSSYVDGDMIVPGAATSGQMYELGAAVGHMHKLLKAHAPGGHPLHWSPHTKANTLQAWERNWKEALAYDDKAAAAKYIQALPKQRELLESFDCRNLEACEIGWAHWDLFADNLFFSGDRLAAILDFDRMNVVFTEFDLSRPLLSGTIGEAGMNIQAAKAYVAGFSEHMPICKDILLRAIHLTWWKEASWLSVRSIPFHTLSRFADELVWIGDHWHELDDICGELAK